MSTEIQSLEQAFTAAIGVFRGTGALEQFLAFLAEGAFVIDEDTPFVLDKAGFTDHLNFHLGGNWDSVAWVPRDVRYEIVGPAGVISGSFTFRGKPRSAGFRLRHGNFSLLCVRERDTWRAMSFVLSPLSSHVVDASPS
jgi:hypothetical protein